MDVTVVVATRDRADDLGRTLPRHGAEVIVVDNASGDDTPSVARRLGARVVELAGNHGACARNVGVRLARTPYVAFADDDSYWAPGALERAGLAMDRHPRLGLLAGRVLVGYENRLDPVSGIMAEAPLGRAPDLPGPSVPDAGEPTGDILFGG